MLPLRAQLKAARKKNARGLWFVPNGSLRAILSKEAVLRQLEECSIAIEVRDEILEHILHDSISVFATLVHIGQESGIVQCVSNQLRDINLPVGPEAVEELGLDHRFGDKQWIYIAPIFKRRTVLLTLKDSHILPILEDVEMKGGGFSKSFRVTVDAQNQELVTISPGETVGVVRAANCSCTILKHSPPGSRPFQKGVNYQGRRR